MMTKEELMQNISDGNIVQAENIDLYDGEKPISYDDKLTWSKLIIDQAVSFDFKCDFTAKVMEMYESKELCLKGSLAYYLSASKRLDKAGIPIRPFSIEEWIYACAHPVLAKMITPFLSKDIMIGGVSYSSSSLLKIIEPTPMYQNAETTRLYWICTLDKLLKDDNDSIHDFILRMNITPAFSVNEIDEIIDNYLELVLGVRLMEQTGYYYSVASGIYDTPIHLLNKLPLEDITSSCTDGLWLYNHLYDLMGDEVFHYNFFQPDPVEYSLDKIIALKKFVMAKRHVEDIYFCLRKDITSHMILTMVDYITDNSKYERIKAFLVEKIENDVYVTPYILRSFIAYLRYQEDNNMKHYINSLSLTSNSKKINTILEGYKNQNIHDTVSDLINHYTGPLENAFESAKEKYSFDNNMIEFINAVEDAVEQTLYENRQKDIQTKKEQREKDRDLNMDSIKDTAIQVINDFVTGDIRTKKQYKEKYTLSDSRFNLYVQTVEKYDSNLYEQYVQKIEAIRKQQYIIFANNAKSIIEKIQKAASQKNTYHLLDFYMDTRMNLTDMDQLVKDGSMFSPSEKRIFKRYVYSNISKQKPLVFKTAYEEVWQVGDHKVSDSEKKEFISYMQRNHIPMYTSLYREVGRRIMKGDIAPAAMEMISKHKSNQEGENADTEPATTDNYNN